MSNELKDHLCLSYAELEERNLAAKEARRNRVPIGKIQEERLRYLRTKNGSRPLPCSSATSKAACTCSITTKSFW